MSLAGLSTNVQPVGDRRADLAQRQVDRVVPRRDEPAHADRLLEDEVEEVARGRRRDLAADHPGRRCIEHDPVDGRVDLALADVADGLAHLDRDEPGERFGLRAQQPGELHEDRRSLAAGRRGPGAVVERRGARPRSRASRSSTPDRGAIATSSPFDGSRLSIVAPDGGLGPAAIDVVGDGDRRPGSCLGHRAPRMVSMVSSSAVSSRSSSMVSGGQSLMTFSSVPPTAERPRRARTRRGGSRAVRPASGVARLAVGHELDADEQPEAADLADARLAAERDRSRSSARAPSVADRSASRSSRSTPIAAEPGGEVDRVRHERRGVRARRPVRHERRAADDRRHGQPAADALADGHQVRHDAPVLRRPTSARSARSRTGPRRR